MLSKTKSDQIITKSDFWTINNQWRYESCDNAQLIYGQITPYIDLFLVLNGLFQSCLNPNCFPWLLRKPGQYRQAQALFEFFKAFSVTKNIVEKRENTYESEVYLSVHNK